MVTFGLWLAAIALFKLIFGDWAIVAMIATLFINLWFWTTYDKVKRRPDRY